MFSSGSRGFRVLDPTVDRAHQLLYERPGSVAMRLEEALELLPVERGPDLLVMELATGGERLRLLCDGYGLDATARARLLDELLAQRRGRLQRGDWRVTKRSVVEANLHWLEEHREGLARFLA